MATFRISDGQSTEYWSDYLSQRTNDKASMRSSGVLRDNAELRARMADGERFWNFPFFLELGATAEDYPTDNPGDTNEPDKIETNRYAAVRLDRARSWEVADLARDITGTNPMAEIFGKVGDWAAVREDWNVHGYLDGVKRANATAPAADDPHKQGDMIITKIGNSKSSDSTARQLKDSDFIDILARFDGYRFGEQVIRGVCFIHPVQLANLRKKDITNFVPPSQQLPFTVYKEFIMISDRRVQSGRFITNDGTQVAAAANGFENYEMVVMGPGSIHFAGGRTDVAFDQDYTKGNGGWVESLHYKRHYSIYVPGFRWNLTTKTNPGLTTRLATSGVEASRTLNGIASPTAGHINSGASHKQVDSSERIPVLFVQTEEVQIAGA